MGKKITVSGADYSANNVNTDNPYMNFRGDHITGATFSGTALTVVNSTPATFEVAATNEIKSATITFPPGADELLTMIVIGVLNDGNFAVLFANTGGNIRRFRKDGVTDSAILYTMSPAPAVALGSPITVTIMSDRIRITYPTYTGDVLFTNIAKLAAPVIGVAATGASSTFTFVTLG